MRVLVSLLAIFLSINVLAQTKTQRQLEELEHRRFEAMTKKDSNFLQNVLDNELTYIHSNGLVETKTQHIDNILSGTIVYKFMRPDELLVRVYKKSAVVTGVVFVNGMFKGKEFDICLRFTDVYVKRKGKWKLAAWQSLRVD